MKDVDEKTINNTANYNGASVYKNRVYNGFGKPDSNAQLQYGPNIRDWPEVISLTDNLIIKLATVINDPVTTTDELIPSGETSSYRSNPLKLAEFALSRKDPKYVERAKEIYSNELARRESGIKDEYLDAIKVANVELKGTTSIGSGVFAIKPGDGSAREQAASCQRVLGGVCNISREYATKRYRSNLINWGMLPFINKDDEFEINDIIIVLGIKEGIETNNLEFNAKLVRNGKAKDIKLYCDALTPDEREIIRQGCLINYYKSQM